MERGLIFSCLSMMKRSEQDGRSVKAELHQRLGERRHTAWKPGEIPISGCSGSLRRVVQTEAIPDSKSPEKGRKWLECLVVEEQPLLWIKQSSLTHGTVMLYHGEMYADSMLLYVT